MTPSAATRFFGEADFDGLHIAASGPVRVGGQSTYNGLITFTNVRRDMVARLLPANFQLAERTTTDLPDLHPAVLLFGDQTDAATVNDDDITPTGIHYSEMIFAIPFVQRVGRSGWHTHIIRMYLDNDAAVAAGTIFGYQKQKACFEWRCPWHDGESASAEIPNFRDMVSIMTTRILGQTEGVPICSHFEWSLRGAKVAALKGSFSMRQPFRDGMGDWPGLSPFDNATDGAIVVRGMRWRLASLPEFCS